MSTAALLLIWAFPFWLPAAVCPDWSLGYQSREACDRAREVAELRGYDTERCELLPVVVTTRMAEER